MAISARELNEGNRNMHISGADIDILLIADVSVTGQNSVTILRILREGAARHHQHDGANHNSLHANSHGSFPTGLVR